MIKHLQAAETVRLESDGHIGISAEITLYYDRTKGEPRPGYFGTPIVVYVTGTAVARVGRESDGVILASMLERGYAVAVLDYLGSPLAVPPELDRSVQGLRNRLRRGEFLPGELFPQGEYIENFVVPAGYDLSLYHEFWAADRHGADGTLEKIVENWNNDFRGCRADRLIPWVYKNGQRKEVADDFDGNAPVWYDADGNEDPRGTFTKVRFTVARDVTDCVKPDGSPIELRQFMHIVYPVNPEKPVPVMCLTNSGEYMSAAPQTADRPHMNGFLFRGYAGVVYDHMYTPMVRADAYKYYDGEPRKGMNAVSGDRWTYSVHLYNGNKINTAAMRYLRYLALSQPDTYRFDTDAIGLYGNSKGGWMNFLGRKILRAPLIADPQNCADTAELEEKISRAVTAFPEQRQFPGHHSETRWDNGITGDYEKDGVTVHGGEPQPWLTFEGKELTAGVQFIYASNGGCEDEITDGHAPSFQAAHMFDEFHAAHGYTNTVVNLSRCHNIPLTYFEVPLPHTLVYGTDMQFGTDTYCALYDAAGYWLRHDPVRLLYTAPTAESEKVHPITVKFSGSVPQSQAAAMTVTDASGAAMDGTWSSLYGDTEWIFTPDEPLDAEVVYTVTVPASLSGDNGAPLGQTVRACFSGKNAAFCPKRTQSGETKTVFHRDFSKGIGSCTPGPYARIAPAKAPDGTDALQVILGDNTGRFHGSVFYVNPTTAVTVPHLLGERPLGTEDVGRRFTVKVTVFDTVSRTVRLMLNGCTSGKDNTLDYRRSIYQLPTRAGEWTEFSFDYQVYEPLFGEIGCQTKTLTISATPDGDRQSPMYIGAITAEEKI